ncbi:hypothetical protein JVU11DRAFT_7612 [Chiua virens]|nr:hypothetical protein JVU11DRAFT_7612 [Chiua virens]
MFAWLKSLLGLTYQLNAEDIVVLYVPETCIDSFYPDFPPVPSLVGPSGGGKSWFMQEVTKSALITPSKTLQPSTTKPAAIRCALTDEAKVALRVSTENNIVFVDTPSFHADGTRTATKETERWLKKSKAKCTRVGVVYVDRVETNPAKGSVQDHLNAFASTFPNGFNCLPRRLCMLLSYESRMTDHKIKNHREAFRAQLDALGVSLTGGKEVIRWDRTFCPELFVDDNHPDEIAWRVVEQLFTT